MQICKFDKKKLLAQTITFPQLYLMQLFYDIMLDRMTLLQVSASGRRRDIRKSTHTREVERDFLGNQEMGRRDALTRAYAAAAERWMPLPP